MEHHSLGTGESGWCHLAHRGDLEVGVLFVIREVRTPA